MSSHKNTFKREPTRVGFALDRKIPISTNLCVFQPVQDRVNVRFLQEKRFQKSRHFLASRCAAKGSEGIGGGAGECADAVPMTCANHVAESQARHTVLKGLSKILTDFRFSFLFLFNKIPVKHLFYFIFIWELNMGMLKNFKIITTWLLSYIFLTFLWAFGYKMHLYDLQFG